MIGGDLNNSPFAALSLSPDCKLKGLILITVREAVELLNAVLHNGFHFTLSFFIIYVISRGAVSRFPAVCDHTPTIVCSTNLYRVDSGLNI